MPSMLRRVLIVFLGIALLPAAPAAAAALPEKAPEPELQILSPVDGETVDGPVQVRTALSGCTEADVLEASAYLNDVLAQKLVAPPFVFRLRPQKSLKLQPLLVVFTLKDGRKLRAARRIFYSREDETIVRRILVPLSATLDGRPVTDLSAAEISLSVDGASLPFREFTSDARPVRLLIAVDTSGSMIDGGRLDKAKEAARLFYDKLATGDEIGLMDFNNEVYRLVPIGAPDGAYIAALASLEAKGSTALWEALDLANRELAGGGNRQAALVITDADGRGVESDRMDAEKVGEAYKRSETLLYALFTASSGGGEGDQIAKMAEATGGAALRNIAPADLPAAAGRLLTELRTQYLLAFSPRGEPDGKYHSITLNCKRAGVKLRYRRGFQYGGAEDKPEKPKKK